MAENSRAVSGVQARQAPGAGIRRPAGHAHLDEPGWQGKIADFRTRLIRKDAEGLAEFPVGPVLVDRGDRLDLHVAVTRPHRQGGHLVDRFF